MNIRAIMKNAYLSLRQNTRRSLLTMTGIIIGISSVITILSLGRGFEAYTVKNLTDSNDKNVRVDISFEPTNISQFQNNKMHFFSDEDLNFVRQVEGVEKVEYAKQDQSISNIDIFVRNKKTTKSLGFSKLEKDPIILGRKITHLDEDTHQKVVLITEDTAKDINQDIKKVLGSGLDLKGKLYQIIGIYEGGKSEVFDMTPDIKVPKGTYQYYENAQDNPSQIKITVADNFKPSNISQKVIKKLENIGSSRNFGQYTTFDMTVLTDGIGKVLKILTYFVSSIAGISLFIAGVGVMNMMYTSVSERTKEIGVRRSVGARRVDIRTQFLAEGLMLTVSGGLIGYILGYLVALAISLVLPFKVFPDFLTIILTITITVVIGLLFSITPANMAARKDLVEILR
ncbi:FtsX-like permease family protein (plasmid) [Lactococcus raffinolactis]|nr:ABC transporter permease [Lactococcus raffinolactis]MBW9298887.1 ABC transporter permease [Lactococcus raffinolactis]QIW61847.1 FtsX-like permease family protein [Lactococcus raffinolactis]